MNTQYLERLAMIESGGNPRAKNPNSSAKGLFQFIDSTAQAYGLEDPFDVEQATDAVTRFTQDNKDYLTKRLGREPTYGELYLAHQQGMKGAASLLENPDAPAVELVGEDAIKLNAGASDMTAGEFAEKWTGKFADLDAPEADELSQLSDEELAEIAGINLEPEYSNEELIELSGEDSFFRRVGRDFADREAIAQNLQRQYRGGEVGFPEHAFQMAGKVGAGAIGDVAGQALKSGFSVLGDIDKFLGGYGGMATGAAADAISGIPTPSGKTLGQASGELFSNLGAEYNDFAANNPRAATNVESALNLFMIGVPAAKWGDDVLDSAFQASKALSKKGTTRMSSEQVRSMGGALFEKAERMGGQLKPEFWDDYLNNVSKKLTRKSDLGRGLEKAAGTRQTLDKAVDALTDVKGNPQSLVAIKEADSILGELAEQSVDNMGRYTRQGKDFLQMQHTLRGMIDNASDDMFIGGREAFDTVKEARKMWAAAYKMDDVERIISKADGAAQPNRVIKTGFRRLRDDPKRFKKYTPEEQFAIKKAAKTGTVEAFTMLSGSGIAPLVAGSVGFVTTGPYGATAAIPAFMYRETMKGLSDAMAATKGGRVLDVIQAQSVNQAPLMAAPYLRSGAIGAAKTTAPIGAAYAPQKETLLERTKRIYGEQ